MSTSSATVSFGRIDVSEGRPRLIGSSSGLDIDQLVGALADAKRLPAVRLERRIELNDAKIAALQELRTGLGALRDAVAGLRSPPGLLGADSNIFETKEAFYSSSTTTAPNTLLAVAASAKAAVGSSTIVVERLATAAKLASTGATDAGGEMATTMNGGTAFAGTFTLGLAGGATATIEVDGTESLGELRDRINASSTSSGVSASVIRVSATESRLVLTGTKTGLDVDLATGTGDDVLSILGLSADGGTTASNPLQVAQTARVVFDGVTLERDGNRLTDVADGLTIDLLKAEPGTTVKIDVERSLSGVKEQIQGFVDAFNAVRDTIARQQTVSTSGEVDSEAVLFGSSLVRGIGGDLAGAIAGGVKGLAAGLPKTLGEIGLNLDQNNRLIVDNTKLDQKLLSDVDHIRGVFEFRSTSSSPDLRIISRGGQLPDESFAVAITDADADGVPEAATIGGVAATISGGLVRGAEGSAWEGWTFAWTGSGNSNVDIEASQGIAERLHSFLDAVVDDVGGRITKEIEQLSSGSETLRDEVERIDTRVADFRARIVERFNAMETALSLANAMMKQITATTDSWSGNT